MGKGGRFIGIVGALIALLGAVAPGAPAASESRSQLQGSVELVGAFLAPGPITGAKLSGDRLLLTTVDRLIIYDVEDRTAPTMLSSVASPNTIHGELLATNDRILLLNGYLSTGTVDVWDVEDAADPVLLATVRNVNDEHLSCVLDCRWAYGSDGTILDLSRPGQPVKLDENWKEIAGLPTVALHRLDEYKPGHLLTAPLGQPPSIVDATDPLRPRIVGRTSRGQLSTYLFSSWPARGRHPFLLASVERSPSADCRNRGEGALVTFDARKWPERRTLKPAGAFKTPDPGPGPHDCNGYYFDPHPDFGDNGLTLLPYGSEGLRVVDVGPSGKMTEVGAFVPPVADVWLAFWADEEIFYTVNGTGQVYVLRWVE